MNVTTLRVEGDDAALVSAVARLRLEVTQRWQRDEHSRSGAKYEWSGLVATIADSVDSDAMTRCIHDFLARCEEAQFSFVASSLSAELAIGVSVGDSRQYVALVEIPSRDLTALGALGVSLSFAAYPTSDEANVE